MTTSMLENQMGSIALIEPHDGEIESVSIALDGTARVQFAKLSVYLERGTEHYEIWIYRGVLEIGGAYELALHGQPQAGFDDYVDDAVVSADSVEVSWKELLDRRLVTQMKLSFGSGRTIDINCHDVQLVLQQSIKHVEDWAGPLVSEPQPPR